MPCLAIETGIEKQREQALIESAKKQGWDIQVVQHIPFTQEFRDLPAKFLKRQDVWFHGDIAGCKAAQATTRWQVHAPWERFEVFRYSRPLKNLLVNIPLKAYHLADLANVWLDFPMEDQFFCRPNSGDKPFNGGRISRPNFQRQLETLCFYNPDPKTICLVYPVKTIIAEWRFFIVNKKLVTGSRYKDHGRRCQIRVEPGSNTWVQAKALLQRVTERGYNPAYSWVLDIAKEAPNNQLELGTYKIMEPGASSCCGLYKSDTDKLISALDECF